MISVEYFIIVSFGIVTRFGWLYGLTLNSKIVLRYYSSMMLLLITLLIKLDVIFMVSERSFLKFVDLDIRLAFFVSSECS